MFPKEIYIARRENLKKKIKEGVILFLGNAETAMNYKNNTYPFRQDSSFLYYFGLDIPNLGAIVDVQEGKEVIYGDDPELEDIIWMGKQETLDEKSKKAGINFVKPWNELAVDLKKYIALKRKIHFLPPYRERKQMLIAYLLKCKYDDVPALVSKDLIQLVVNQRSVKDRFEIEEMEKTMSDVTGRAYKEALQHISPGKYEYNISGVIEGTALRSNCRMAYPVICTINGQTLHNHFYGNKLTDGKLLLIDAGAESPMRYATDITRTYPVSGKFTGIQKDIYNIVLKAETESIKAIKPGIPYRDIHLSASAIIAEGLKSMGFLKGNTNDIVNSGAHALFFPHGLGHMIGLDVHDMEDLGENYVGYDENIKRSTQFGLAYLRLAQKLQTGNTLTVEPGIYIIPELIENWRSQKLHKDFINYGLIEKSLDFGGIRIEDNVVVTDKGAAVIGNPIPKTTDEIEAIMNS